MPGYLREWSPRGPATVWLVLWTGDWGVRYEIYGSERLAWKSVKKFIEKSILRMPEIQDAVRQALEAGDDWTAYNLFTERQSSYGNDLDVQKVVVQH